MVTLDLRDGMALNYTFCELVGPKYFDVVVCLTRNTSERLERLLHYSPGSCVRFTNGDCVQPFNGSIAKMQVSMLENNTDRCYPTQHVHFVKSRVSLHDNGIWILGGYWVGSRIIQYCSVHLGVSSRVNPCPLWVKIIIVVVFIVFAAVVTLAIVVFCRWYHKSKSLNSWEYQCTSW